MYKVCFSVTEFLECVLLLFCRLRPDIEELTTVTYEVEHNNMFLVCIEVMWLAASAIQNAS